MSDRFSIWKKKVVSGICNTAYDGCFQDSINIKGVRRVLEEAIPEFREEINKLEKAYKGLLADKMGPLSWAITKVFKKGHVYTQRELINEFSCDASQEDIEYVLISLVEKGKLVEKPLHCASEYDTFCYERVDWSNKF